MLALPEYSATTLDRIHCCDALTLLRALPSGFVDCVVTDPPYGIGYASSRKTRRDGKPRDTMPDFGKDVFDSSWLPECERVLKPMGAMYMFTRWDVIGQWKEAIEQTGLKVVERIVWNKLHWTMGNLKYYGSQIEDILFCIKGNHLMQWEKRQGNIWNACTMPGTNGDANYDHPTQKPTRLMTKAIENSSNPGDTILDPFIGSGTTAVAARNLGRHFIGCDISADYVRIARERLALPYTIPMFT